MKNVTIAIPDEVYRQARILAAERGISLSALVAEYLRCASQRESEFARLEALQRQVQAEIERFSGADRLDRQEVHDRAIR